MVGIPFGIGRWRLSTLVWLVQLCAFCRPNLGLAAGPTTQAKFEAIAGELEFFDPGNVLRNSQHTYSNTADRAAPSRYFALLARVLDPTIPTADLPALLQHRDPRVRTLALAALFDREDPRWLPLIVECVNDQAVTFASHPPLFDTGILSGVSSGPPPLTQRVGEIATGQSSLRRWRNLAGVRTST